MYHAKDRGGNTYEFFNSSMNVVSARRLSVETRLRRALERNEFKLVYQPIRDAVTGRLSAAEALIRWVDASGEAIGPDEFIPIAEETGLIVEIGAWVLRTACLQARDWRAAGYAPFRLSVNIAVGQLSDLGIVEGVETEAQARFLMELGCDELQGYLFSRPLPPDEFGALLELEGKQQTS